MKDITFVITENKEVDSGVFRMMLAGKDLPPFVPMQFLNLTVPHRPDMLLRRPFCIYRAGVDLVEIIYAVVGKGTRVLAGLKSGKTLTALYPLGNGFVRRSGQKAIALVGGGIGAAPLLSVAEQNRDARVTAYLGFATAPAANVFAGDFAVACDTRICTDDGSIGKKGFPTDALATDIAAGRVPDVIVTCGSLPLIKAVKKIALDHKVPAFMSGETRMACGIGACLVCACKQNMDGGFVNKRACIDGPVFDLAITELD